jgi:hypothetical protein
MYCTFIFKIFRNIMFITTICTYLITTISNADAFKCSEESMLGDHRITLEHIQCEEEYDTCHWHYDLGTIYLTSPTKNRPILLGLPVPEDNEIMMYEDNYSYPPNIVYYENGIGAKYCESFGEDYDDYDCQGKNDTYGVGDNNLRVLAIHNYWNSFTVSSALYNSNTQCIEMTYMDDNGNILSTQINGPAPLFITAPPSYPSIEIPESYVVTKIEEIVLPSENMRFRIVERGTDGCATKVQYFDGLDQYGEPRWADAEFDTNEYSYLGMPGQMCPESITTENPCYFYSGTNYYVIPCK